MPDIERTDPTDARICAGSLEAAPATGSAMGSQFVLLGAFLVRSVLVLGTTALLGRTLEADAFGFFARISTLYFIAHETMNLGTLPLAVRQISRDPAGERRLLEGLLGWRSLCAVGLALGAIALAAFEADGSRRWVLVGVAVSLFALPPWGIYAAFQVRQAHAGPAVTTVLGQALVLIGGALMHLASAAGPLFAWCIVARELCTAAAIHVLGVRKLGYRPRPRIRGVGLGSFLGSSLVLGLAMLMHALYVHVDVLLVEWLRGEAELGAYAAASRPMTSLMALPGILAVPVLPLLTATLQRGGAFAREAAVIGAFFLGIGGVSLVVGSGLARDGLELLYGGRYLEGTLGALASLEWLVLALGAVFVVSPYVSALIARGRERALLAIGFAGLCANVVGNWIVLPRLGFTGAAQVTAFTELGVACAVVLVFWHGERRDFVSRLHLWALLPALLLVPTLELLPGGPVLRLALGLPLGAVACASILLLPGGREVRTSLLHRD